MRIAFDAKRAYYNETGLGNYSRVLLNSLFRYHPQHEYWLATPGITGMFTPPTADNVHVLTPGFIGGMMKPLWRSSMVKKDLLQRNIDLYHGLSHEIPVGIQSTGIRSVVTIHDLIFERYPEQYNPADVRIYRSKFQNACQHADKIIAISKATKQDIAEYYEIPERRITVCYQSCHESFLQCAGQEAKDRLRALYKLPEQFYLYVGSVIERKNLLLICKAMQVLKSKMNIPVVVVGTGGKYMQQVKEYLRANGLEERVIFLSERGPVTQAQLPALYQMCLALLYPSISEGFGIPVLEAMSSHVPVITSKTSCMPETGGDAAYYIDPFSVEEMAFAMNKLAKDADTRAGMIERGNTQAAKFSQEATAAQVMAVYEGVMTAAR